MTFVLQNVQAEVVRRESRERMEVEVDWSVGSVTIGTGTGPSAFDGTSRTQYARSPRKVLLRLATEQSFNLYSTNY